MISSKKKLIRDYLNLIVTILFSWLYIPHYILYLIRRKKGDVVKDVTRMVDTISLHLPSSMAFLYFIHHNRYFRTLFYHRIGPIAALMIGWWRPGDRYFVISNTTQIGEGAYFVHPYSTIINAKSIGKNFSCRHLTTLGNKRDGDNDNRPVIGDNVTLGCNVTIIGSVHVGNNVVVGAGSIVVKDVPDDCVVAGNPARILHSL